MERFPLLEVIFKRISKENSLRNKLKSLLLSGNKKTNTDYSDQDKEEYFDYIRSLGIVKGDILILHSSIDELSKIKINALEVINLLLELIGAEGTLVIPTFPLYNKENTKGEYFIYNTKKTSCWTGLLPNIFLRYPGVIRSKFPYNTLAAKGMHASLMMKDNLLDNKIYGANSAWVYCIEHSAKVLFLGTPAFHTTTISHIPEDLLGNQWPINNFYKEKNFVIEDNNEMIDFSVSVREEYWASNIKSHYRTFLLRKRNLLSENLVSDIYIGYINNSKDVVNYLTDMAIKNKTMYYVPRKFRKK